jgi:hypothetical protein
LEGTLKKLALVATAATALICAAALVTTSAEAKKHHHKKHPAAAPTSAMAGGPGYMGGPGMGDRHDLGGPMKSGGMCWKDKDVWANTGQGYWGKC